MTADYSDVSLSAVNEYCYRWIACSSNIHTYVSVILTQADTPSQIHPPQSCPLDARQRALLLAIAWDAAHMLHISYLMQSVYDSIYQRPTTALIAIADLLNELQDWFAHYGVMPKRSSVDPALCVRGERWHLSLALFALLYPVEFASCEPFGCELEIERGTDCVIFRITSAIDMRQQQGLTVVCADWSSVDIARRLIEWYEGRLSMEVRDGRLICAVSLPLAKAGKLAQVDEHRSAAGGSISHALLRRWQKIGQGYGQSIEQYLHELSMIDVPPQFQGDLLRVFASTMMWNVRKFFSVWQLFAYHCAPAPQPSKAALTTVEAILAAAQAQLGRFGAVLAVTSPTPAVLISGNAERLGHALGYLLHPFEYEMHKPSRCALSMKALPDEIVFHITSGVDLRGIADAQTLVYDGSSMYVARMLIAQHGGSVAMERRGDTLHATVRLPLAAG